jgi:hypothetical protein
MHFHIKSILQTIQHLNVTHKNPIPWRDSNPRLEFLMQIRCPLYHASSTLHCSCGVGWGAEWVVGLHLSP